MGGEFTIVINGERRKLPAGTSVADLIVHLGLEGRRVAVERNRVIVPRADHAKTFLAEGDVLEVLHFVGGG